MSTDPALRPVELAQEPDFALASLSVRPSSREVVKGSEKEVLEPRVMQVLVLLARQRGQVVSRDQLIEVCWAGRVVGEDAINRCIARVRRLAETHGGFAVETIARVGYRLTETREEAAAPAKVQWRRWIAVALIAVLIVGVALLIEILRQRSLIADERTSMATQQTFMANQKTSQLDGIATYIDQDRYGAAFNYARALSQSEKSDPRFAKLWQQIVIPIKPLVAQSGATVYFKAYDDSHEGDWIEAGTTPLTQWVDAPRGAIRLKVTKQGFSTGYFVAAVPGPSVETQLPQRFPFDTPSVPLELAPEGKLPQDMVLVPHTDVPVYLSGWSTDLLGSDRHDIPAFAIARSEVTNHDFKEFIDAGGYDDAQYWQGLKFRYRGQTLSWQEARKLFVDATGRPGPAAWQLSTYPAKQDFYPVGGISWYEAIAYSRFRKQLLPTIHHWMRAAFTPYDPMFPTAAAITEQSVFSATEPWPALVEQGLGPWGTYHMAGNVREWVSNLAGEDAVALGSGWPEYASNFARVYTAEPMSRLPDHGLRLMQTLGDTKIDPALLEPIKLVRDTEFANRAPLSDDAFEAMRFQFTTPRVAPTSVTVTQIDSSPLWIAEEVKLTFASQEPNTLYVVRPKTHQGPLQPIVYSGVGDCCFMKRPNRDALEQLQIAGFVVNSGRALVMPIWAGGYERYLAPPTDRAAINDRERRVALLWQHDLSTTIDYLETRPDMDAKNIGYLGISRGASFAGAINLALEPRIRGAVLASGGIWIHSPLHPMIDLINYAPRITIPVLMLSGRYDHIYPYEQSQKRTFELLGTRPADKKQIAYDTGHFTMPQNRVAADVSNWFDQHLGRVGK